MVGAVVLANCPRQPLSEGSLRIVPERPEGVFQFGRLFAVAQAVRRIGCRTGVDPVGFALVRSLKGITGGGYAKKDCRRGSLRGSTLDQLLVAQDTVGDGGGELVS